jgi:hypothetical protein
MRHKMGIIQRWLLIMANSVKQSFITSNILMFVDLKYPQCTVGDSGLLGYKAVLLCLCNVSNIVFSSNRMKDVHEQCTVLGPPFKKSGNTNPEICYMPENLNIHMQCVSTFLRIKLKCHKEHRINPIWLWKMNIQEEEKCNVQ